MAGSGGEVRLKLLIDSEQKRVLFGEADKNLIDFLFNLLSLPLGTVIRLLKKQGMVGSLANLYESVEALNDTYLQPNQSKDNLLKPKVSFSASTLLLPNIESYADKKKFYLCGNRCGYNVASNPTAVCPSCRNAMSRECALVNPPNANTQATQDVGEFGGFVKGVVTYMVMDDLSVKPMSTISSITLLNKFNIKEVGALEEKVITLDVNQGVKLLRASLQSKTVLTDVFLGRKF
ncbi:DUF674 domain-containing protein [Cucumis melo var. makuwa]|uniref:DUF674 domain-containing protein n=2 Tax=Cucumis melo TaxID=3656 RepID=A0A5A7U8V2_CUCMM|nr:DUF674 domain-containing protein [Cucumis melo var. makuwa]TYJ97778.1 DUF674 domain-containing protein [Cucumis melo var. makuwa]